MDTPISGLDQLVSAWIGLWNEPDVNTVRLQLEAIADKGIVCFSPAVETHGFDQWMSALQVYRKMVPQHAVLRRTSEIDSHHNFHRYAWEITMGDKQLVVGLTVAEVNAAGKLVRVMGFNGKLPDL